MSAGAAGPSQPVVLRQTGALLVPAAVWVFCTGAVLDAVIETSAGLALKVTVLMGTIAYAAWMLLFSPCLVVKYDGVRIVNPLRVHWIPYDALDDVLVRGLTTFVAREESGRLRSITSWNAPGQPRKYTLSTAPVAQVIERSRAAWERRIGAAATPGVLVTSWRRRPALALVLLVAANVAIWFR